MIAISDTGETRAADDEASVDLHSDDDYVSDAPPAPENDALWRQYDSPKAAEALQARTNVIMCALAVASFVVTCLALDVCFDIETRIVSSCAAGRALLWLSFLLLLALLACVITYYRHRAAHHALTDRLDSISAALWHTDLKWRLVGELCVLLLQPLPWVSAAQFWFGPRFVVFMFLRCYILLRAFHYRSTVNQHRDEIVTELHLSSAMPILHFTPPPPAALSTSGSGTALDLMNASPTAAAASASPRATDMHSAFMRRRAASTVVGLGFVGGARGSVMGVPGRGGGGAVADLHKAHQQDLRRHRRRTQQIRSGKHSLHVLDFYTVLKTTFHADPLTACIAMLVFMLFFCAYAVHICERTYFVDLNTRAYIDTLDNPHANAFVGLTPTKFASLSNCLWFAIVATSTVGFGEMVPVGAFGRTVVGISIIGGVIWSSLIVGYVSGVIAPTPFQRSVLEWVKTRHLRERKRDIAARIIQCAWREVLRRRADIAQRKARAQSAATAAAAAGLGQTLSTILAPLSNMISRSARKAPPMHRRASSNTASPVLSGRIAPDDAVLARPERRNSDDPRSLASVSASVPPRLALDDLDVAPSRSLPSSPARRAASLNVNFADALALPPVPAIELPPIAPPLTFSFASAMRSLGGNASSAGGASPKNRAADTAPPGSQRFRSAAAAAAAAKVEVKKPMRLPRIAQLARTLHAVMGEEEDRAEIRALHSGGDGGDGGGGGGGNVRAVLNEVMGALASMESNMARLLDERTETRVQIEELQRALLASQEENARERRLLTAALERVMHTGFAARATSV